MKRLIPALMLALIATGAHAAPAGMMLAESGNTVTVQDLKGGSRGGMTLDQAVNKVRRDTGGRILSAKTVKKGGVSVHRIKVLTPDKRVVVYEIDR